MNGHSDPANTLASPQAVSPWSQRVWVVLVSILFINSVLRGIRPPNIWVLTQFLLNYDFGFAKRALHGAVIGALGIPALYSYSFIFWYMMTFLAANALLLLWITRRLCATEDLTSQLIASLFAASLGVVALAHFVGYGEQPALLVVLLALAIQKFHQRCIFVAVLFPLCLLIQETEFVIFFPLIVFRFLIDLGDTVTTQRRRLVGLCLVTLCVIVVLLALGNTQLSEATATAMIQSLEPKAAYPLNHEQAIPLTTTFKEFLDIMIRVYIAVPGMRRFLFLSCLVTLPTTIYLMRRTWLLMTHSGYSIFLRAVAMGASISPLTLIIIAGDANRFVSFAVITSFVAYATVRLQGSTTDAPASTKSDLLLPIGLIVMNLSSSLPLFDGYVVRSFPYEELLHDLRNTLSLQEPFPPLPEQCSIIPPKRCVFIQPALEPPESAVSASHVSKP